MIFGHSKYLFPIAALLMGCFFVMTACENDLQVVEGLYKKKIGVEEAFSIESYLSQDGYVKAKLASPYMLRYQADSPYLEFPRTLHVDFFDSTAKRESYLDAQYGKYFEFERKVLLRDSVVVINMKNGDTLRTKKLWWDQNKSEFYTDDTAYIFQPDKIILAASGLQAAQNLTNIKFFNSSGILSVPKSDSTSGPPTDSLSAPAPDSTRPFRPFPPARKDSTQ
jgi:LPS export ABC transporter protein LptC